MSLINIVDLVERVQQVQRERRPATDAELQFFSSWMGWGAYKDAFETNKGEHWAEVGADLRQLLGKEGVEAAKAALNSSYFTHPAYIKLMWKMALDLGFTGGNVLELGCGSGSFMAAAPQGLPISITGIEREPISAAIASFRVPGARIIQGALERTVLVNGVYDYVTGNLPFGDIRIYAHDSSRFTLHNYFLWRIFQALRPGGLAILITSRYTLDSKDDDQRKALTEYGSLLGAIRLPNGAHRGAGTDALSDILILQKKTKRVPWQGHEWNGVTEDVIKGERINTYFTTHRQNILGTPIVTRGLYRYEELKVLPPDNFEERLDQATAAIVAEAREQGAIYQPPVDLTAITDIVPVRADGRKEGSFHVDEEGHLIQIRDGQPTGVARKQAEIDELVALVGLRDATLALLEAERDEESTDQLLTPLRQKLNELYESYVDRFGYLHRAMKVYSQRDGEEVMSRRRPGAHVAWREDPDGVHVLALEEFDDDKGEARKAAIFFRRINVPMVRQTTASTPAEALAYCLDEYGRLDLPYIAKLLKVSRLEVPAKLGDLAYQEPFSEKWVSSSDYLSGNVLEKLDQARAMEALHPGRYTRNIEALEKVAPTPIPFWEIKGFLGAHWIPADVVALFCKELLGGREVAVFYEPHTDTWEVEEPFNPNSKPEAREWGTYRFSAYKIIEHALNKRRPESSEYGNDALLAQEKLEAIQQRFATWLWKDTDRAQRLAGIYNRLHNALVPQKWDGSHLTFPGMDPEWQKKLYSWQKDFVWQAINSPGALNGHPMGAGKTMEEIMLAMTLQRMGLATRVALVVPNHILEQVAAEAQRLYPGARILMVDAEDINKENRKIFATRIATGSHDIIIMTYTSFAAIGVHPYTEMMTLERRIADYRQVLANIKENAYTASKQNKTIRRIEKLIERLRQRQYDLMHMKRDDGLTFEQLNISYLIIDEMQNFKRLGLPTNIDSLKVQPSQRANDLEMKLYYLRQRNQGRPYGAGFTGTPFSNNMVEVYVLAHYFCPDLLEEMGLTTVDAFAAQFVEFRTRIEVAVNGVGFRQRTGPACYVNMPEFLALLSSFADIRSPEILDEKKPIREDITIAMDPSEETTAFVNSLVKRYELINKKEPITIQGGRYGSYKDNPLVITNQGRWAALDLSLVGIEAKTSPKLEAIVKAMLEVWRQNQVDMAFLPGEHKSLQIGFCDLGTPNKDGDNLYGKVKAMLIAGGMPAKAIRFIHEAKNPKQKEKLFSQCRSGEVAIILGSTDKMGTGTNIQDRCAAIHHMSVCWRPDEIEQREARGWRPGNLYARVKIFRYVQRRTFDAYAWQILATKAIPFDQVRRGKIQSREMDALGETAMTYAQVCASATGDDVVLKQAEIDMDLSKLLRLQDAYINERRIDAHTANRYRGNAAELAKRAQTWQAIAQAATAYPAPALVKKYHDTLTDPVAIGARITKEIQSQLYYEGGREYVGHYRGSSLVVRVRTWEKKYEVDLLLGEEYNNYPVSFDVDKDWMKKKYHFFFVKHLDDALAKAEERGAHLEGMSRQEAEKAATFEQEAQAPFPHLAKLEALQAQKAVADRYIELVTDFKDDPAFTEEIAALREQILGFEKQQASPMVAQEETPAQAEPPAPAEIPLAVIASGAPVFLYNGRNITNLAGVVAALTMKQYKPSGARRLLETQGIEPVVRIAGDKFYDLAEVEALNGKNIRPGRKPKASITPLFAEEERAS